MECHPLNFLPAMPPAVTRSEIRHSNQVPAVRQVD